ncbi:MAG: sensor histidine kinase [Flavobacteriales bacterium]
MGKERKRIVYWAANMLGWGGYVSLTAFIMQGEGTLTKERLQALILAFPLGILLSHGMRLLYIRLGWLDRSIKALIPRVLLAVLFSGALFFLLHTLLLGGFGEEQALPWGLPPFDVIQSVINWSILFFFWSAIYMAYHFFEEHRRKEVEALEWQASKSELELEQLKDQLDPHFIFNCLNSIRALIEEEPIKAKKAVTKLSNTLRNSLTLSRKSTIRLKEELRVVQDHLELERIRLEERLVTDIQVPDEVLDQPIPPLLIQSLVENGVKHGVSKLPEGGCLKLKVEMGEARCFITVSNPVPHEGTRDENKAPGTQSGLENARKRIRLLYGEKGDLQREREGYTVRTIIELPLSHAFANDHNR